MRIILKAKEHEIMKKLNFMLVMLMIVVIIFTACSNQDNKVNSYVDNSVSFLADKNESVSTELTTENNTTTIVAEKSTSEKAISTTKMPAEQKSAGQTTTKKFTTTQKQTTTKRQTTTKKVTTTQKATTHKVTTTKKPTTTKGTPTKHTHTMPCGNVGKWYSSKDAFMSDYYAEADYWNNKLDNDEISYEEYISKVPRGYEVWQCSCSKWTGNYKYK